MTALLVCVGAALGAPARYLTDQVLRARFGAAFPWGTAAVNVVGSFVLGVVAGAALPVELVALVGTGFCGALTTYSTFGYETLRLVEEGAGRIALLNVLVGVVGGIGAAALGHAVGVAL